MNDVYPEEFKKIESSIGQWLTSIICIYIYIYWYRKPIFRISNVIEQYSGQNKETLRDGSLQNDVIYFHPFGTATSVATRLGDVFEACLSNLYVEATYQSLLQCPCWWIVINPPMGMILHICRYTCGRVESFGSYIYRYMYISLYYSVHIYICIYIYMYVCM